MKKSEFIDALAKKVNKPKTEADAWLNAVLDLVQENLKAGEKITLTGFGTFEVRTRAARKGVNIRTGKPIDIPAGKRPVFTAGAVLKESVSEKTAKKAPAKKSSGKKAAGKK